MVPMGVLKKQTKWKTKIQPPADIQFAIQSPVWKVNNFMYLNFVTKHIKWDMPGIDLSV